MPGKDPLARVEKRPNPDDWRGDEPIMLREAVALFFPEGPLTISSFRAAIRRGELGFVKVAGKLFTTPDAVREMTRPFLQTQTAPATAPSLGQPIADGRAAQGRARATLKNLRFKATAGGTY